MFQGKEKTTTKKREMNFRKKIYTYIDVMLKVKLVQCQLHGKIIIYETEDIENLPHI